MKISTIKKAVPIALFWLLVWQIIHVAVGLELIVPSPYSAFRSFCLLLASAAFYRDAAATVLRCVSGILLSFVFGLGTALLSYKFSVVRSLLSLPVLIFKATPVMAIILLLLLCLTSGKVPVFVCFLMCYPVVYTNILSGLDRISVQHLELSKLYHLNANDMIAFIILPSVRPEISASLNLIAGLSWKTVVAAEVLATPQFSMGYNMLNSKIYLETANLFAWIIAIICFSLIFEKVMKLAFKHYEPKPYAGSKVLKRAKMELPDSKATAGALNEPPEIRVSGLHKSYPGKAVFSGLSVCFPKGLATAITAPSGRGKTTLLRVVSGLEGYAEGEISGVGNVGISFLFQENRLLPWLNVFDNTALFLKDKLPAPEIESEVMSMLEHLELAPNANDLPSQLSGGMAHRAALARAFLCPAQILLLDEPFRELDSDLKDRIIERVWRNCTYNKTVLIVTHSHEDTDTLSDGQIAL